MLGKINSLLLLFVLLCSPVYGECVLEWCSAPFPPTDGSDRSIGVTNCGDVCIKILYSDEEKCEKNEENEMCNCEIKGGMLHYFPGDGTVELYCLPTSFPVE